MGASETEIRVIAPLTNASGANVDVGGSISRCLNVCGKKYLDIYIYIYVIYTYIYIYIFINARAVLTRTRAMSE